MKKLTLLFFFLLFNPLIHSQNNQELITIEFANINRKSILEKIESVSSYTFYFDEKWLTDTTLLSGNYTDKKIDLILTTIFEDTNLNFYINNNKVILTKNSVIYQNLPSDYFDNKLASGTDTKTVNPIFFQQYDSIKKEDSRSEQVDLIGKESLNSENKLHTLFGHIKNAKNGEPLADITVKVKNSTTSTATDIDGNFILQIAPGINTIEINALNFKKVVKRVVVYSDGKLNIDLSEKINQLREVVVKGKRKQLQRVAVSGLTTIEAEGIKNIPLVLGERDVLKVALTIPGIKTAGEGSAGFNVRGGKDDQNLILLDNATIYNPTHFLGFFSSLNPYTVSKLDIYKGGIPSEFGGRLSSVFDITSKKGNFDHVAGEGSIGPVTSNLTASTPIVKGKSALLVGGRATYSGWILRSLKNEKLQNSKASFYDVIAKYNHNINQNNAIEATLYYSKDAYSISSDSLYKYSNRLASLKWKHTFNEKNKGELNITNSEYKFDIDYDSSQDLYDSFDFGYKLSETQATLKFSYLFNEKHKFTYGISSKLYGIKPGSLYPKNAQSLIIPISIDKERGLESAGFISDSYKVTKKLLLDFGVRYSIFAALGESTQKIYQEGLPLSDATVVEEKQFGKNEVITTYSGFEPRLAVRYMFNDSFSIKAGYDKTQQYIHLLSSNTTQSPTDTWKLSNLNVKPQSGEQFSLGLFKNIDYQELELSVEGYYKKAKNLLDYKVGANLLLNENLETELLQGEGKSYGIEFLVKKQEGRLNGWIGYTYSRAFIKLDSQFNDERVNNGKFFPTNFDKPHDFSAVLNYKLTKRYSFSANFIYQTGRPITYPIGKYNYGGIEYTLYSDRNKFRIPDYYRLDLGVNIEGNHKIKKLAHSFWNVSVYNVLGKNNPYSVYFVTEQGTVKAYKTSIFAMPIPTITYNFKF